MGSKKANIGTLERFLTEHYEEIVRGVVMRFDPDTGSQTSVAKRTFKRTGITGEGLAHEAMARLMKTIDIVELMRVPEKERKPYLFGCIFHSARVIYVRILRQENNRKRLEATPGFIDGATSSLHDGQEGVRAFEYEDALSQLPPEQRAIIRNCEDTSLRVLHQRMASSTARCTFNKRVRVKMTEARKILYPE